ncbi:hypothetical protein ACL9RI_07910 [Janthinobacterium sp. Mn2066]|uniref:hypothetical protein n=1 Tax=Janthinobacterium sp. Mn2066 TaxID=3395264 RepID=UPI003BBE6D5A
MKIVYFNPELSARAPDLLGVFCVDPSGHWLTMQDIDAALASGEDVEIRQSTETEIERATAVAILYEIELELARQVGGLLDPSAAAIDSVVAVVTSAFTAVPTELSADSAPVELEPAIEHTLPATNNHPADIDALLKKHGGE